MKLRTVLIQNRKMVSQAKRNKKRASCMYDLLLTNIRYSHPNASKAFSRPFHRTNTVLMYIMHVHRNTMFKQHFVKYRIAR